MRIAKYSFAYPLLKYTFSVLGSSKCEVLSVLDLKEAFHSLRLSEIRKKERLWDASLFWEGILLVSENAYGIKCIPLHMAILHQCNS